MDRLLNDLNPRFKPLAIELIARIVEADIPIVIVDTLRTQGEQEDAIRRGVSWVRHSKHQDGLAIDLVPYLLYRKGPFGREIKLNWDVTAPEWARMAGIARGLGLTCGFDWKRKDLGHYELSDVADRLDT